MQGDSIAKVVFAIEKAYNLAQSQIIGTKPTYQGRNYKPVTLNSYMQGCLNEEFPENFSFCKGRRFYLKINGNILFCKKLDKNYKPCNIQTRTVKMYNEQLTENEDDNMPITYIGYRVTPSYSELLGIYAVHMTGGNIDWIADLADLAYTQKDQCLSVMSSISVAEATVTPKIGVALRKAE